MDGGTYGSFDRYALPDVPSPNCSAFVDRDDVQRRFEMNTLFLGLLLLSLIATFIVDTRQKRRQFVVEKIKPRRFRN
jgi:hypothetical protein